MEGGDKGEISVGRGNSRSVGIGRRKLFGVGVEGTLGGTEGQKLEGDGSEESHSEITAIDRGGGGWR